VYDLIKKITEICEKLKADNIYVLQLNRSLQTGRDGNAVETGVKTVGQRQRGITNLQSEEEDQRENGR
jgi:hypothetical protein